MAKARKIAFLFLFFCYFCLDNFSWSLEANAKLSDDAKVENSDDAAIVIVTIPPKNDSTNNNSDDADAHANRNAKEKKANAEWVPAFLFSAPFALTGVQVAMNLLHEPLFQSYFSQGAYAQAETAVMALVLMSSILACAISCENEYRCCGRFTKSTRLGIAAALLSHILLGAGATANIVVSCWNSECSGGSYRPITIPALVIPLFVTIISSYELFVRKCHKR
jgi:hypothetical protein